MPLEWRDGVRGPVAVFNRSEATLGITFSHAPAATTSALDGTQDTIDVRGTAPLLVRQDIDTKFLFATLD